MGPSPKGTWWRNVRLLTPAAQEGGQQRPGSRVAATPDLQVQGAPGGRGEEGRAGGAQIWTLVHPLCPPGKLPPWIQMAIWGAGRRPPQDHRGL